MLTPSVGYWIGVASQDHVEAAIEGGFCQLSHGKASAVARLKPKDWIAYYSPRTSMGEGILVQAFTAIGSVIDGEPYSVDTGGGFIPWRRNVGFLPALRAPIRPLLEQLTFIKNQTRWAATFRFGVLSIPHNDLPSSPAPWALRR